MCIFATENDTAMKRLNKISAAMTLFLNKVKRFCAENFAWKMRNLLIITPPPLKNHFNRITRGFSHGTVAGRTNCGIILVSIYGDMVLVQERLGALQFPQTASSDVLRERVSSENRF